jgi:predicted MPP superfamily phosphohydrolase
MLLFLALYRRVAGLHRLGPERWGYVSRGTGYWGPPLRVLAPPEVTCLVISPAGGSG